MNRRNLLQSTAATIACAAIRARAATAARIVDTHTHFYDPTRKEGVPWPGKGTPLHRTVLPADWRKVASPHGVTDTVIVEASQRVEDNQWILDLAAGEKCIAGFIGNLDPTDAGFSANLKRFAANPLFRGIRWRGDLVRIDATLDQVKRRARELSDAGLVLELNGRPAMLAHAAKIARELPGLRIMIDHVGGAGDPAHLGDEWREGIAAAGKSKNVFLKVSALTEQTGQSAKQYGSAPRDTAYYKPVLDHCWECFGEDRLVYGSNWPVCEKGGAYGDQFKIVSEYFGAKGAGASGKYFWKNSREVYRWIDRA
jgi:predicted TIM-barrel fold metal-dependent hydrolase